MLPRQVTSGAVTVGRQRLFHQHVLNSSPLKMQINAGSPSIQTCSARIPSRRQHLAWHWHAAGHTACMPPDAAATHERLPTCQQAGSS